MSSLLLVAIITAAGDPPAAAPLPTIVSAEPDAVWTAKFRRTDGWVGADGSFSVALSDRRTLWLFSDTWVGSIRDNKRTGVKMVNNTVGVQTGRGADAKIDYTVKTDADGKSVAIFVPPDGMGWFWQFAGHHAAGKLQVFLPRFEKTKAKGAFGFRAVDLWLGTVANPDAEPAKWETKYTKVPFADFTATKKWAFGSAVLRDGDHAFIYGHADEPGKLFGQRRLIVARAPADDLAAFDQWRFYTDGEWKTDAAAATPLADGLATEMSVTYLPGLKQYALVYTENGLGDRIVGRFAPTPVGPWSTPVLLYRCPEMKTDKKVFSYSGKAHPHLAGPNELVLTYAVNAFELGPVINDATLYWPNVVRVVLK